MLNMLIKMHYFIKFLVFCLWSRLLVIEKWLLDIDVVDAYHFWQLKQDNEEFRVMYREGPEGTPLHSLLVEGYVEGPLDACEFHWSTWENFGLHHRILNWWEKNWVNHSFIYQFWSSFLRSVLHCRFLCCLGVNPLQQMVRLLSIIVDFALCIISF